jgi:hypothetical protein
LRHSHPSMTEVNILFGSFWGNVLPIPIRGTYGTSTCKNSLPLKY